MMRILVWGINYSPEQTGIAPCNAALCEFLQARKHQVRMVTSFAYYPSWRKRAEDMGTLFRTDFVAGVPVHRCWHYVPRTVKAWKRIIHEASFVATSFVRCLTLPRADVMVVVSPPLLLGMAAAILGVLRGMPFVFHVQDLQPDAAIGLGMLKPGWLTRSLYALEAFSYRRAARVSGITHGMLRAFAEKGVPVSKCLYFPNGVRLRGESEIPTRGMFRERMGFDRDHVIALYSGNLGVKQGLPVLIDAAAGVSDARVQLIICGDGAEREGLAALIAERRLMNVHLLPLQEHGQYEEMLADADLCFVTQQAGTGQFFFPSKLLTTLAFEKPVLAVADEESELAAALRDGDFGWCVPPGNPAAIAGVLNMVAQNRAGLAGLGARGRAYIERFETGRVLADFEQALLHVVAERGRTRRAGQSRVIGMVLGFSALLTFAFQESEKENHRFDILRGDLSSSELRGQPTRVARRNIPGDWLLCEDSRRAQLRALLA